MAAPEEKARLRDKYPLAFRPPSPPLPPLWREMTDDEIMAVEIPGVDPNAPPTLHADQVDMAICEKLREIDNNMAAVHSVLAYEILPGLKEYARVTEPIREVSRFWISMFEAACAPKEQPDVPVEEENSAAHTPDATTPTASSTSRTDPQDRTPTASEDPSFVQFNESDGRSGLMTSTPAGHRVKKPSSKIFNDRESPGTSATEESMQTRLRRQMESLRLESVDMSDTSTGTASISPTSISTSSLSSFKSKEERSERSTKGKGRIQHDLRAKALQNVAFGAMQKAYGPVFTERPSASSYNTTLGSDSSAITSGFTHKPSSIFNPGALPAPNNQPPLIFTRRAAPSSTTTAQQRLVHNLLKEAEHDKRTGVPVGASLPSRSPARFSTLRHAVDTANAISLSTDDDTMSTRGAGVPFHRNLYENEDFDGMEEDLDDSFSDSDEDEEEEEDGRNGDHNGHLPMMPAQYMMEDEYPSDNTGWQINSNPDNHDGTTNVFGGGRAVAGGGDFRLRDVYRGAEPDSFVAETPILARHAGARHFG